MEKNQIIQMPNSKIAEWWKDEAKLKAFRGKFNKDLNDAELDMFLIQCQRTCLDPFSNQIYCFKMGGRVIWMASIDGLRVKAERTGRYAPGKETTFQYDEKKNLISATAYVKKMTEDGTWHEVAVTAFLSEYDKKSGCWNDKKHVMLAKCAEAQALRRAFPADLSGLYVKEELDKSGDGRLEEVSVEIKEEKNPPKLESYINVAQSVELAYLIKKCPQAFEKRIFTYYKIGTIDHLPENAYEIVKKGALKEIQMKKEKESEVTLVAFDVFQQKEVAHA